MKFCSIKLPSSYITFKQIIKVNCALELFNWNEELMGIDDVI